MTHLTPTALLERLVAFDSVSRNSNLPMADFIADYLDRPGVRIDRDAPDDEPKVNLIVAVGPEADPEARDGLVLSGHMDVVPADEPEWTSDPFTLTRRDGRLYGRGAADMKGFLALAIDAVAQADPNALRHPLVLVLTYDEEVGTLGAKHLHEHWSAPQRLPRAAIIGEPTSLTVVRAHKGFVKLQITLHGVSAHSGYPHLGKSAIEPAGPLITALSELRAALAAERPPHSALFPEVPYAALNIGLIAGGSAVNVVPDRCRLDLGVRLLPGMEADEMLGRVRAAVAPVLADVPHDFELLGTSRPLLSPTDAPIYRYLCDVVGCERDEGVSYATDAGWLQEMGMDCVIFGPGSIEVAHKPNEFMPLDEYERGREIIADAVRAFCYEDGP